MSKALKIFGQFLKDEDAPPLLNIRCCSEYS
jgi:hypothetical protein